MVHIVGHGVGKDKGKRIQQQGKDKEEMPRQ
jgi:hypothetical protein